MSKFILLLLLIGAFGCSKKGHNKCYTHWTSPFNHKLIVGCDRTIIYERPEPTPCKINGNYDELGGGEILWYLDETCTGQRSVDAFCFLIVNEEYTNFGCRELGINQTFYKNI